MDLLLFFFKVVILTFKVTINKVYLKENIQYML